MTRYARFAVSKQGDGTGQSGSQLPPVDVRNSTEWDKWTSDGAISRKSGLGWRITPFPSGNHLLGLEKLSLIGLTATQPQRGPTSHVNLQDCRKCTREAHGHKLVTLFYINAQASKPRATLTAQSSILPAGGSVTLSCSVEGSAGWKFDWFRRDSVSSKAQLMRGNEANRVINVSQGGLYHCRGGRGDPVFSTEDSSDVTVRETHKPKAKLRADNTAVPVGGSVTLTCSVNPSSSSGWKYYWYRDEKSSEALTTQDAVFHSNGQISVSQEGLYRCRGGRGNPVYYTEDSQSVRIGKTVTVSGADSSSSPVWLIVGLVCGVSLIIILLLLLYRCRQSKCADEPRDVTYSLITLQNLRKKKKHHKPEQSAVYSEVKTGAADHQILVTLHLSHTKTISQI
ncbi:G patch domain-containing protein 1 [Sarotherodon galilaeus]